jgi:hypothetical protein
MSVGATLHYAANRRIVLKGANESLIEGAAIDLQAELVWPWALDKIYNSPRWNFLWLATALAIVSLAK